MRTTHGLFLLPTFGNGAQVYVRYHPTDYSNHELQLEKFKKLNKKISTLYSIPQSELNKTLSRHKPQPTPSNGVVDPEDKLRRFTIDWKTVRSMLKEATGKVQLGSSALTLPETNRLQSSHLFLQNSQCDSTSYRKRTFIAVTASNRISLQTRGPFRRTGMILRKKALHLGRHCRQSNASHHRDLRSESRGSTTTNGCVPKQ